MAPHVPNDLPLTLAGEEYARLIRLVGEANSALAEYSGLLQGIVNPAVMLSPLMNQEAVLSSKIEGTQATMEEVLEHEAGEVFDERKSTDIQEILNYRKALMLAQEELSGGREISLSLLLQLHAILLDSVRGQHKSPGEFRKEQNWIGRAGCSIESATFVPPSPLQLHDHLEAWQQYLSVNDFDVLAQAAIVHAQFELLHPFKDGNGRIGRLLIPLFLFAKKRLYSPMFYLSDYLETHRDEYYVRLSAISRENDWVGWIEFFLNAVVVQAKDNVKKVRQIIGLYDATKEQVQSITHSQHSLALVDTLFDRPIFRVTDFCRRSGISKPTLHGLLRQLKEPKGPVVTLRKGSGRRSAIYAFPALLTIVKTDSFLPE